MYKKVELPKEGFVGIERQVAEGWKKKDIIKKNFAMNEGKRYFTFYDGPPTANGKPHVGHIETRVVKDIIPRYKVMKGYKVDRKAGWDTHGLPVELEIEKKLGISGKEQRKTRKQDFLCYRRSTAGTVYPYVQRTGSGSGNPHFSRG